MLDEQLALSACVISQKARVAKSCFHASTALTFSPFECHKRTWLMKTITGTYFAKPSQAKPSQAKPSQAKPSQAKPSQALIGRLVPHPLSRNWALPRVPGKDRR